MNILRTTEITTDKQTDRHGKKERKLVNGKRERDQIERESARE